MMPKCTKLSSVVLAVTLFGCDAYPTVVQNRTVRPISITYHQREYDFWSGTIKVGPKNATRLAREHWIQDIIGIRITDADRTYELTGDRLTPLRDACPSMELGRRYNLAHDCYLTYLGDGHLAATPVMPPDLQFEELGNTGGHDPV
jgi:hypothetical protein